MRKKTVLFFALFFIFLLLALWWGFNLSRQPKPSPSPGPAEEVFPKKISDFQTQIYMKKRTYDITYIPSLNEYAIVIYGIPFEPARKEAEQAFLEKLGLLSTQACGLRVTISTPPFVNPEESKQTYSLSFCGTSPAPNP